jgi:RES domain-containing protein
LTVFSIPKSVPIEIVDAVSLSKGWDGPITTSVTQDIGTEWLKSMRSAVLRIPAVVIEGEFNYLLNPRHSDFSSITILPSRPFRFDARLRPPTVLKEIL